MLVIAILAWGLHVLVVRSVREVVPWPFQPELTWVRPNGAVLSHSLLGHLPHFLIGVAAARLFLARRPRPGIAWDFAFWVSAVLVGSINAAVMLPVIWIDQMRTQRRLTSRERSD